MDIRNSAQLQATLAKTNNTEDRHIADVCKTQQYAFTFEATVFSGAEPKTVPDYCRIMMRVNHSLSIPTSDTNSRTCSG